MQLDKRCRSLILVGGDEIEAVLYACSAITRGRQLDAARRLALRAAEVDFMSPRCHGEPKVLEIRAEDIALLVFASQQFCLNEKRVRCGRGVPKATQLAIHEMAELAL